MVAVTQADADPARALGTVREYRAALQLVKRTHPDWQPPVMSVSSLANRGLDGVWDRILEHRRRMTANGFFETRRRAQQKDWMWSLLKDRLLDGFLARPGMAARIAAAETGVMRGDLTVASAVIDLLEGT